MATCFCTPKLLFPAPERLSATNCPSRFASVPSQDQFPSRVPHTQIAVNQGHVQLYMRLYPDGQLGRPRLVRTSIPPGGTNTSAVVPPFHFPSSSMFTSWNCTVSSSCFELDLLV
jgi:hypothetical protein